MVLSWAACLTSRHFAFWHRECPMRRVFVSLAILSLVALFCLVFGRSPAAAPPEGAGGAKEAATPSVHKPYGIETRVPWTTSHVKGTPEPPPPYRSEVAFPKLKFSSPLDLVGAPGVDRLFAAERYGKIFSFPLDRNASEAKLLIDLKK